MTLLQSILLGIVQGLTEFLPVSSSGHLTLFGAWLGAAGAEGDPSYSFFVVVTHFGTLLAILIYYRRDLGAMISALWRTTFRGFRPLEDDRDDLRLVGIILLGTVPAVVIGFLFEDWFDERFEDPLSAALFLSVTGLILLSTRWTASRAQRAVGWRSGFLVGLAQALAILPGISRSGSTISMGLAAGIRQKEAARFAFLLAVPALFGAALLKGLEIETLASVNWTVQIAGMIAAFVSGYLALVWLIRLLERQGFWKFALYTWAVSILALALIFTGRLG